jgi:predicted small integral membrane protein
MALNDKETMRQSLDLYTQSVKSNIFRGDRLFLGVISNLFLLLNMARRARISLALPGFAYHNSWMVLQTTKYWVHR